MTSYNCLPGLSHALRITMLQVAASRQAAIGRGEKTEMLYTYVTGSEFKQSVEAMFEIICCLDQDFIKEKRAVTMAWKRREKQLERLANCVTGFFANLQGIVGVGALPTIYVLVHTDLLEIYKDSKAELHQAVLV